MLSIADYLMQFILKHVKKVHSEESNREIRQEGRSFQDDRLEISICLSEGPKVQRTLLEIPWRTPWETPVEQPWAAL